MPASVPAPWAEALDGQRLRVVAPGGPEASGGLLDLTDLDQGVGRGRVAEL